MKKFCIHPDGGTGFGGRALGMGSFAAAWLRTDAPVVAHTGDDATTGIPQGSPGSTPPR